MQVGFECLSKHILLNKSKYGNKIIIKILQSRIGAININFMQLLQHIKMHNYWLHWKRNSLKGIGMTTASGNNRL